ncbi:hypothetical protein TMES_10250 [Thalassospira mesophila]|uniref:DUF3644 domain-containing protein n=2 Tax=Thalassospira mesophila TaxID=1293891 RepID=A0A1Y2L2Y4_9PROT|nr:hypothetical protein TMES_10250 [Thalassospira mesophila]
MGNRLTNYEVSMVKAMVEDTGLQDQDIQSYFTRPARTINHARISDIRHGRARNSVNRASPEELQGFFDQWPGYDLETGLSTDGDDLVVKAREAMIAAVYVFNSAGLYFKTELFIVTAIISWTYAMHAWFRKHRIDYRYSVRGEVQLTANGAEKYIELGACLRHERNPLSNGVRKNLEFLLEIRHEIEHRSTQKIDEAVGAKLQACCLNFNSFIKREFGPQCGLDRRLSLALQFSTFGTDQRNYLKKESNLPRHIEMTIDHFENNLTEDEISDPAYRYNVVFVPVIKQRRSAADSAVEFIKAETQEERARVSQIFLREVDRKRYTATQVVGLMKTAGYPNFSIRNHTELWQKLDAKRSEAGLGNRGDYQGSWVWFESWVRRVRAHCEENAEKYA